MIQHKIEIPSIPIALELPKPHGFKEGNIVSIKLPGYLQNLICEVTSIQYSSSKSDNVVLKTINNTSKVNGDHHFAN